MAPAGAELRGPTSLQSIVVDGSTLVWEEHPASAKACIKGVKTRWDEGEAHFSPWAADSGMRSTKLVQSSAEPANPPNPQAGYGRSADHPRS
ncbi:hypothetical protein GCM10007874_22490 [Labrys miyagiensis]|uniref:Uncharacterized protein n=1 Tax=Labrys miyagiensis TaxID=346912 RepID=A0ABQ6CFU4_9HYPH|nr:hypothetical protein GCM10007874_22490 [Labrys miyagiensis]